MKALQQEYEPVENDTGKVPTTNKESQEATPPETTTEEATPPETTTEEATLTTEDESYEVTLPPIQTSSHGAAEDDVYETISAENWLTIITRNLPQAC